MKNDTLKQELLKAIEDSENSTFFEKVDKNLNNKNIQLLDKVMYSQLKNEFIAGNTPHNFHQRLITFANSIIYSDVSSKYDNILEYVSEISKHIDSILFSNQKVLLPYIKSEAHKNITIEAMTDLFELQKKRSLFGKWIAYLKKIENLDNISISKHITELIKVLKKIKITLYEVWNKKTTKSDEYAFFKKGLMIDFLRNEGYDESKKIINKYLNNLRGKSEKIGEILGNLEFEINNNTNIDLITSKIDG